MGQTSTGSSGCPSLQFSSRSPSMRSCHVLPALACVCLVLALGVCDDNEEHGGGGGGHVGHGGGHGGGKLAHYPGSAGCNKVPASKSYGGTCYFQYTRHGFVRRSCPEGAMFSVRACGCVGVA